MWADLNGLRLEIIHGFEKNEKLHWREGNEFSESPKHYFIEQGYHYKVTMWQVDRNNSFVIKLGKFLSKNVYNCFLREVEHVIQS